jgi:GNAT superfamily N-acetyltransferase
MNTPTQPLYESHPLTPDRWPDLKTLFGKSGASGGCWCMFWRLPHAKFIKMKGEENCQAFKSLVEAGPPPGLLAYAGNNPIGWIALAPRSEYNRLEKSRILRPVDERPTWSITCFYVARPFRKKGVTLMLLKAAAQYARQQGASLLEGYPIDTTGQEKLQDSSIYTGIMSAFIRAGFVEVERRSPTRPIMRLDLI